MTVEMLQNMCNTDSTDQEELKQLAKDMLDKNRIDLVAYASVLANINLQNITVEEPADENIDVPQFQGSISEYLEPNNSYAVFFTNLDNINNQEIHLNNLNLNSELGYIGNWTIANNREFNKVLLYIRQDGVNSIYLADYSNRQQVEGIMFRVYFSNLIDRGITPLNWANFNNANNLQTTIRYYDS